MLALNVKRILLENKFSDIEPGTMTQLAAAIGISHKHLLDLVRRGREDDVERIAKGLRVSTKKLCS